ncbi:MAG: SLBB domain-containing protein [Candidatus Delongbacteria bacterium]
MRLTLLPGLTALCFCLCLCLAAHALDLKDLEGLGGSAGTGSAPSVPAPSWVLEGPIDPSTYRLGPGDHVGLFAYNVERNREERIVESDGRLELPGLGRVPAAGLTLAELRRENARQLARLFRCDSVDLWITWPRTIRVQISGAVEEPRWVELPYLTRLSATLERQPEEQKLPDPEATLPAFLRGKKDEVRLSWRNVRILRGADTLSVDLLRRLRTGDADSDPILEAGDRVVWGLEDAVLTVSGPFRQADGELEYRPGDTPRSVVELLGGPRQGLTGARYEVVRTPAAGPARSWNLTPADPLFASLALQPHDRLFLRVDNARAAGDEASVEGEVLMPGTFAVDGETTLADLLALARPDSARADLAHVRVIRELRHDPETRYMGEILRSGWLNRFEHDYLKSRLLHEGGRVSLTYDSQYFDPARVPILDGDRIQVLRKTPDVEVLGAVHEPGSQKLQPGWTVGDYVQAAGGKLRGARNSELRLRRAGADQFAPASQGANVEAGDVIMIMYRDEMTAWEKFKEGLAVTAQIMTVVLVVRSI